ncbi:MAG: NADH-quinone oxidoreductase subunit B [Chloroflexi bacterium]|nr:NADH-quinone oxidoreductase subunit B [Chloroflexota bacterium]
MAVDEPQPEALPLFVPVEWKDRPKEGRYFDSPEQAGISTGKGNRPAPNLLPSATPGVITAKLDQLAALGRANSLWTLTFGLACCAIEMISTHMAHHDLDRFGVVTWPSPRQSDVMIVAGTVVKKMADPIRLLYEQMPDPKWVIAMGTCATSGGPYFRSYSVVMGVDHIVPVDVYVPGCPPRPEALMDGILKLQDKIKRDAREGPSKTARPGEGDG